MTRIDLKHSVGMRCYSITLKIERLSCILDVEHFKNKFNIKSWRDETAERERQKGQKLRGTDGIFL